MAKKITIQHWYTTNTGTTAVPPAGELTLGEIAISAGKGSEGIYFKNNDNEVVEVLTSGQTYELIEKATSGITTDNAFQMHREKKASEYNDDTKNDVNKYGHVLLHNGDLNGVTSELGVAAGIEHTHGQYLTNIIPGSGQPIVSIIEDGVATIGLTTGITNQINSGVSGYTRIENHEPKSGTTEEIGHVKLVGGDLSGKTGDVINGEAAASHHIHSQYIAKDDISNGLEIWKKNNDAKELLRVKAAPNGGINVDDNGVSINGDYQDKIASGVTAYGWGNHANAGYAKNDDLTAHGNNSGIHVTTDDKEKWNQATEDINAFFNENATISGAVDTLKEIQDFLTSDDGTVQTLLDNLSALTDTVSGNTDDINALSGIVSTNTDDINSLKTNKVGFISVESDNNLSANIDSSVVNDKAYKIKHTTASTQSSAITATNASTGLNFGDTFEFVNKIGYDKNGHVVSGDTQTLTLPTLPVANETVSGVVKLVWGNIALPSNLQGTLISGHAAASYHWHDDYVKFTDLSANTGNIITISCGTY